MDGRIVEDIKVNYGITCQDIIPIKGGWLNRLWRASTDRGDLLIKQYSNKRFGKEQLQSIEAALLRQAAIEREKIACPHIYQSKGRIIRVLDDATAYMIMSFCEGNNETAQTITSKQMQSLGNACALMHKAFSKLPEETVKGFPIDSRQVLASLWENYHMRKRNITADDPEEYQAALLACEPVLSQLTEKFFDSIPKGIAHEDFTSDNVLFQEDGVAAIIDFDRNRYSFIWHDIGRAILSFALEDNRLNTEKVHAFADGYSRHIPLTIANISDALRITWCMEVPWWILPECFAMDCGGKATRYRDEILWLTEHWSALE